MIIFVRFLGILNDSRVLLTGPFFLLERLNSLANFGQKFRRDFEEFVYSMSLHISVLKFIKKRTSFLPFSSFRQVKIKTQLFNKLFPFSHDLNFRP